MTEFHVSEHWWRKVCYLLGTDNGHSTSLNGQDPGVLNPNGAFPCARSGFKMLASISRVLVLCRVSRLPCTSLWCHVLHTSSAEIAIGIGYKVLTALSPVLCDCHFTCFVLVGASVAMGVGYDGLHISFHEGPSRPVCVCSLLHR